MSDSIRRDETLQLLEPVLDDDDAGRRGGVFQSPAFLEHQEPLTVRRKGDVAKQTKARGRVVWRRVEQRPTPAAI